MASKLVYRYEVIDHGIEHSSYFQGCGTSHTQYEDVATGIGDSATEAFEYALEMLASSGWDVDNITVPSDLGEETVSELREEERSESLVCGRCGENADGCGCEDGPDVDDDADDWDGDERWYHVSVRVRGETAEEAQYRELRDRARDALRLPADVDDGILADAMEDNPCFSMEEVEVIRYGIDD